MMMAGAMLLTAGCKSLFSSSRSTTESRWTNYAEVEVSFQKIKPDCTGVNELQAFGFHPSVSPNVKILTYVDIIKIFMPSAGIQKADLPEAVRGCIDAHERSHAYLVELQDIRAVRHGNLFLDILGFKRRTHESGWRFHGLILVKDDIVVYKISSGEPQVSREERRDKPLGPLQELDGIFSRAVDLAK